jgi:hypothetical protein
MALDKQQIVQGLFAVGTPDNPGASGKAKVGNTDIEGGTSVAPRTRSYPLADIVSAFRITSAATANVATLTVTTGAVAQTTGSPVISGAQVDFEGDTLGTPAKFCAIRIRTKSTNTGTVTLGGSNSSAFPAMVLDAGADLLLSFPAAGKTVTGTIAFTFSAAADVCWVEFLAID